MSVCLINEEWLSILPQRVIRREEEKEDEEEEEEDVGRWERLEKGARGAGSLSW